MFVKERAPGGTGQMAVSIDVRVKALEDDLIGMC